MLTPERAKHLWQNQKYGSIREQKPRFGGVAHESGLTEKERAHVLEVWDTLPGNTSFMTAFFKIMNGGAK